MVGFPNNHGVCFPTKNHHFGVFLALEVPPFKETRIYHQLYKWIHPWVNPLCRYIHHVALFKAKATNSPLWLFSFWIHGTCLYTCNMGKPQKGTCFWSSWCKKIHRYPECSFTLRWSYLSIQGVPGWWHIIIEPRCIEHAPTHGQHSFVKGSTTISLENTPIRMILCIGRPGRVFRVSICCAWKRSLKRFFPALEAGGGSLEF